MKKRSVQSVGLCALLICLILGISSNGSAYDEKNPLVLKCGISSPATEDEARAVTMLGNVVQKRTNGRLQFKYFYGASLIKKPQLVEGVAR
ncbi:MAG: hypothetical protein ABII06_20610, partial [Pseudomonadota bacterium]